MPEKERRHEKEAYEEEDKTKNELLKGITWGQAIDMLSNWVQANPSIQVNVIQ